MTDDFERVQAQWRLGFWADRPMDSCPPAYEAVEALISDKVAAIRSYQTHELGGCTIYSLDETKMKCLAQRTRYFLHRLEALISENDLKLPPELVCYFPDSFLSRRLNFFDLRYPLIVEGRHCLNSAGILFTAPERYWREWKRMPPGFDEIPFLEKKPSLFGRLSLNGSFVDQEGELVVGYPSTDHLFAHFDRVRFVEAASGKSRCNAGLTVRKDRQLADYPPAAQRVIRRWFRAPSTLDEQLRYRYLISIDGRGYSGSLYWMLASNSVVFRSEPRYHTAFEVGLRPFIHYVPLLPNFTDIDEKIDWCEDNPEECTRIVKNAHDYLRRFYEQGMEERVTIRLLEHLGRRA